MKTRDSSLRRGFLMLVVLLVELGAPPAAQASEWVPLHLLRTSDTGALLCVDLPHGAHAGRWLIDTGSSVNLAAPRTAQRWRQPDAQRIGLHTAQGVRHGLVVDLPDFGIGNLPPATLKVVEFDLDAFVGAAADNLAGVLGAPFFEALRLELDLPNARARFMQADTVSRSAATRASTVIALTRPRGLPVLQLQIDDQPPEGFLFDTGHTGALVRLAGSGHLLAPDARSTRMARRVMMGTVQREKVPVVDVSGSGLGRVLPAGVVGSAGVALFETCHIALELRAQRLELSGCDSVTLRGGFGLQLQHDSHRLSVSNVMAGSPAERAGLRAGDEIVRLAGRQQFDSLGAAWHELAMANEVELAVRRGTTEFVRRLKRAHFLPLLP
jgi:PDZ domain/Aspartyl protease